MRVKNQKLDLMIRKSVRSNGLRANPRFTAFALMAGLFVVKLILIRELKDHPLIQPDAGLDTTAYVTLARQVIGGNTALGPGLYFVLAALHLLSCRASRDLRLLHDRARRPGAARHRVRRIHLPHGEEVVFRTRRMDRLDPCRPDRTLHVLRVADPAGLDRWIPDVCLAARPHTRIA